MTTDGKLLKFATLEAYEKAVNHEQAELQEEMLTSIKKASFPNYFSTSTVIEKNANAKEGQEMDDFLGQLLNKDGAVQIGEHIYKVDLQKEKVFVIEAKNSISDYSDLINGRTSNKNVKEFSTDDDVLYIVRDGVSEKCGGIGGFDIYSDLEELPGMSGINFNCRIKFFRAGIFFNLYAEAITSEHNRGFAKLYLELSPVWYKKRPCGSGDEVGPYNVVGYQSFSDWNWAGPYQKYQSYQGSRNLNFCRFRARAKAESGSVVTYTNWIQNY